MSEATAAPPEDATLHEIVDEVRALADQIEEAGGEITDEIADELSRWEGALEDKAARIIRYEQTMARKAEGAKAESDRLRDLATTYNNRAKSLRKLLQTALQRLGMQSVETEVGKRYLQRTPPKAGLKVDVDHLPEEFVRVVPETKEPDKKAIIAAWKDGRDVSAYADVVQDVTLRGK